MPAFIIFKRTSSHVGNKDQDVKIEEQRDGMTKRMRKKGCNLRDKKLMNNSRCEASQTRKISSKREGASRVIYPSSYGVIALQ